MTSTDPTNSGTTHINAPAGVPFITIVREFDAPVDALYHAYTDPDLVARWLGPRRYTLTIREWDLRSGGTWSYAHTVPGEDAFYGFHGSFHSVDPGKRIVQTFEFEGAPGHVSLESATFEPVGDRSRVVVHSVYQSLEARDAMISSGMEGGVTEGYEQLDDILAEQGA
ncbi:MAG: polyketide cyclase [Glaciihabitans sp.]|nr:polyketide cyclase [Glaciihabitans sp.]